MAKFKLFILNNSYHFLLSLFILNILDGAFTWALVANDLAREVNPVMDFLMKIDFSVFFGFKLLVSFLAIRYLWKRTTSNFSQSMVIFGLFVIYVALLINHLRLLYLVFQIIS